jgi:hypothetical protein
VVSFLDRCEGLVKVNTKIMGKKKNKSFYKKQLKPFLKSNKVVLAALTGAATGIALASVLGTEKARQLVETVEDSIKDFSSKVKNEISKNSYKSADQTALKKQNA